jgi:heme exporter protein C
LPLLFTVLGFYCFFGAVLLLRMRLALLQREARSQWARDVISARAGSDKSLGSIL